MLNILMDIMIHFSIQHILLKGLHKYSITISEIFWGVKMENRFFGQIKKTLDIGDPAQD